MTRQLTLQSKALVAAVFLLGIWFTFDVIRSAIRKGTRGKYHYYTRTDAPARYYFFMVFKAVLVVIIWGALYLLFFRN